MSYIYTARNNHTYTATYKGDENLFRVTRPNGTGKTLVGSISSEMKVTSLTWRGWERSEPAPHAETRRFLTMDAAIATLAELDETAPRIASSSCPA